VYKTNPHTLEELWNICYNISKISGEELGWVNSTVFHRYTEYIWSGGQHFQHLVLHWWIFVRPSKDYYHCDILSCSLCWLLPVLRRGIWHMGIWAYSYACCSRRKRSTLNKFTRKWLWHMYKFQGEFLSAIGVLCLLIILKNHYYYPLCIHFYLDCVILLHGILCVAWNPNLVGDRDHLWDNFFLERTLVRDSYSYINILCVYVQHYKLQVLVYCFQFLLLFVLEHNSAVVSRCRSHKVWGIYIETVTFGTNEEFLLARIQILLLLWYSVSIHISVPATWNYKSTWWAGLVNRTA